MWCKIYKQEIGNYVCRLCSAYCTEREQNIQSMTSITTDKPKEE